MPETLSQWTARYTREVLQAWIQNRVAYDRSLQRLYGVGWSLDDAPALLDRPEMYLAPVPRRRISMLSDSK